MKTSTLESLTAVAAVGSSPLEARVRALGITPIGLKKIDAHKREQVKLHPPNMIGRVLDLLGIQHDRAYDFSNGFRSVAAWTSIAGVYGLATLFVSMYSGTFDEFAATNWTVVAVLASATSLFFSVSAVFFFAVNKKAVYPAIWRLVPYNEAFQTAELSSSVIARSILDRHMLVARNLADIRFEVEELWQGKVKLDPIEWIVDVVTGERIAISVWDEYGNEITL